MTVCRCRCPICCLPLDCCQEERDWIHGGVCAVRFRLGLMQGGVIATREDSIQGENMESVRRDILT